MGLLLRFWQVALGLLAWAALGIVPGYAGAWRAAPPQQLAGGRDYTLCLRADGSLYGWGNLRLAAAPGNTLSPQPITGPAGIRFAQVAGGYTHALALATTGTAYAWGLNLDGWLGDGSTTTRTAPMPVTMPAGVRFTQVAAGAFHSLALSADGTVYAWGRNDRGQLGNGSTTRSLVPMAVAMPAGVRCKQVVAGIDYSVALAADGTAYAWGLNGFGQLGEGTTTTRLTPTPVSLPAGVRLTQLAGGGSHVVALAADGTAYAWGYNALGQLGDGTTTNRLVPVAVGLPAGLRLVQVQASTVHSGGLTEAGMLYTWGSNYEGELGTNGSPAAYATTPTAVTLPAGVRLTQLGTGNYHTLALASTGAYYTWGYNDYGQLGTGSTAAQAAPTLLALAAPAASYTQAAGGFQHALALAANGTAYAWGSNYYGQLGYNTPAGQSPTPGAVALPAGVRLVQVAAGVDYSVALAADGAAYAWGVNNAGQLGSGTSTAATVTPGPVTLPGGKRFVQVAAGFQHALGLAADGTVYAWGANAEYELGDGTTTTRAVPVAVALPAGVRAVQVAAGYQHSLALTVDGQVYAWGGNYAGQLGNSALNTPRSTPTLVALPTGVQVVQLLAGEQFSLALAADGTAYAWGSNSTGQLGDGTTTQRSSPGAVVVPAGVRFRQVAAGYRHALGLGADGSIYSWGHNSRGELGINSTVDQLTAVREYAGLITWVGLGAGASAEFSLAIGQSGAVYSAGDNSAGQLGDGTTTNSLVFIRNTLPLPALAATPLPSGSIQPFPNPSAGALTVQVTAAQAGPATFRLVDALGRCCLLYQTQLPGGNSRVVLPGAEVLAPGLYLLQWQQGTQQACARLLRN